MMVVELGDDMIVIDSGLMFPEDEMLGIDLVLPDYGYIKSNADKLRGIFITHGHEDHTGALPYLLKEVKAPVYGTKLTLGLIERKLGEHQIKADLKVINENSSIKINDMTVEFFSVCHSIPDAIGLIIQTPYGPVIHSGDFKIDPTPVDGKICSFDKIAAYSGKALVLLSDSTGAENPGYTRPEKNVGTNLRSIMSEAKGRVIIASFASHIHRVQQIVNAAFDAKRKLVIVGRSMIENTKVAEQLGYINIPKGMLVDQTQMKKYPPARIVIITTGSQGEPLSALSRMASNDHKFMDIGEGDTVIMSASPIPGNQKSVSQVINRLFKCGAKVYYHSVADVHVSGHGSREELRLLLNLVRPKYFVPVHGEYRHLIYHKELAKEVGIKDQNIFVMENGDVLEFDAEGARQKGRIKAGTIFVDGLGVGDIGHVVLRDRQLLANDGIVIVVATVNVQTGQLIQDPDIVTRGFVYVRDSAALMDETRKKLHEIFKSTSKEEITDLNVLKNRIHTELGRFLYSKTKRQPMIMPIIVEL